MKNTRTHHAAFIILMLSTTKVNATDFLQEQSQGLDDKPSDQNVTTTLDSIQVRATFSAQGAKSAMKQELTVMETPYSVAAYGDDFMKAIETTNISDLYGYMTGVRRGGNTGYDISIRGFKTTQADKNAIMVDGLPGVVGRFGSPPTIASESIEVVKGPASVLYGIAQPGGFVNIITKKPQAKPAATLDIRGMGYTGAGINLDETTGYSIGLDMTGSVNKQQSVLYRVIAEYSDRDSFRHYGWDEGVYLAPSFIFNTTDSSEFRVAFEYRKRKGSYESTQLVAPNKDANLIAGIRTRYQEPDDFLEEAAYSGTVTFSHYFHNGSALNIAARSVRGEDSAKGWDNVGVLPDGVTLRRRARQQENKRNYDYLDSHVSIPFMTGRLEHKFLAGITYGIDTTDFERIQFYNGPTNGIDSLPGTGRINVNIYNPILGLAPPLDSLPTGPINRRHTRNISSGLYITDLISLSEHWKLNLGIRHANERKVIRELKTPPLTRDSASSSAILPTAGLLFQLTPEWTIYGSYATSYVPQTAGVQDAKGTPNPFDPQKGRQYEIGAKTELLAGRLTATLAFFDIEKKNTLAPVSCDEGVGGRCSQQVGAENSRGTEFEVNYAPTENLQICAYFQDVQCHNSASKRRPTDKLIKTNGKPVGAL